MPVNQFRDTINNLENNKITEAQATQAFRTEFAQMSKNGDNDNVETLMQNEFRNKNTLKDFPDPIHPSGGIPINE